jgi:hypothetical protein
VAEQVNVSPIERNPLPIGSIEEAQAQGLDPTQYPTCAKPNKLTGLIGCGWWDKCIVSAKGVNGPKNYGVEIIKGKNTGGGFLRTKADCMWIADHAENIVANKGSIKIIAEEGEEFEMVTGVVVNKQTKQETFQGDPLGQRRKVRKKVLVPPFARPEDNEALMVDVLRAESIELEKERRTDEQRARNYGLESTIAPLDKRSGGQGKGREAKG